MIVFLTGSMYVVCLYIFACIIYMLCIYVVKEVTSLKGAWSINGNGM